MQAAVEGWHSRADPLAAEVVGSSKVFIENDEACSVGQCNGGTMMADAIFDYFSDMEVPGAWSKINAAVVNAAVSRTSFDERVSLGELTLADMYEMYPYEDEYLLVTMRGEKLYAMMEHSVHFEEHTAEKFLQVSGVTDAIVMKRYIRKKTPLFPAVDDRIIFMDAAAWPCPDALLATALAILALRVFRREALPS
ncbi:snake venom 5'-nucleotidase [Ixodes scapularis]|uniref:snake venom 5'-nucleotidase n=1 Tax=Ixodes scapularis TaxID=6945 RepID=UPI001C394073|nr:snake venom 5'-nucleotidase [Ixodes scapularis]